MPGNFMTVKLDFNGRVWELGGQFKILSYNCKEGKGGGRQHELVVNETPLPVHLMWCSLF